MFARTVALAATLALGLAATASAHVHTVQPGETLWGIAAVNGLPLSTVAAANGLPATTKVVVGTNLTIPSGTASAASQAPASSGLVSVGPGESFSSIAARNGTTAAALAAANGLSTSSLLVPGRALRLPSAGSSAAGGVVPGPMGAYTVRPGDTLSGLAARSGVPMAQMAYVNGLDPAKVLLTGTVLKLPTGAAVQASSPAPGQRIVPPANPVPTPARLSAGEVGSIAAAQGVPSSLAAAVAYQESGFNNAMISAANARGIMQIMPGTWDWVQATLAGGRLNPASATDNVRAGSLYLAHLLRETGGDPSTAAAGYYQGLDSVRRVGMLPETRRYVANILALRHRFGG